MDDSSENCKPEYMTGDVASGLDRIRKRLLDPSKSNRLLNFRYYTRSTLRVIDELPNQLFENLIGGRTFVFDPVPEPKSPKDKLEFFQAHPDQLDTPDQLKKIRNVRDIPIPKVELYAKWKGIRTDFELPIPESISDHGRHADTRIQTLLYPKDLEAVASRLSSLSRTAIEETGSNMLFMSFGFLEWAEDDNSEKTYLAPLLLLPAHIERQKQSRDGMFRYTIDYSGEDLQANLSLQEKLKEFGLDLPDISQEGELPEAYFAKVRRVIRGKFDWRIRRHVSLGILQFGKQLLYLDLDPKRWPEHKSITEHDLVSKFFLGGDAGGLDFAQEYNIDELEGDVSDLPLITEADSSQHSAIVDAIKGRSFIIEGPPGTGKSQTITNMIACALARGKTVLFVAEKLAALEVVRRRLNQAGLGDFTLELHSNKTQKRALLDDVETRLKKHRQYRAPHEIDRTLSELHKKRDSLRRHAGYMHDVFSDIDLTPYELLHKATRYEREVLEACPEISDLIKGKGEVFSIDRYLERIDAVNTMMRSIRAIKDSSNSLRRFPWYGVNKYDLRARDRNEIKASFISALSKFSECVEIINELEGLTIQSYDHSSACYSCLLALNDTIISLPETPIWSPVKRLSVRASREQLSEFIGRVSEYHTALAAFCRHFESVLPPTEEDSEGIAVSLQKIQPILNPTSSLDAIGIGLEKIDTLRKDIDNTKQEWLNILESMQTEPAISSEAIGFASSAVKLCAEAPLDKLRYRGDVFDDDIDSLLIGIKAKLTNLLYRREKIERYFSSYLNENIADLKSAARLLANKKLSRFFSISWWNARSVYLRLCNKVEPNSEKSRSEWLIFVADYIESKQSFEDNLDFSTVLNNLFRGLDTDIEGLLSLRRWYSSVREVYGIGFGQSAKFGSKLIALDSNLIKSIGHYEKMGLRDKGLTIAKAVDWLQEHLAQNFEANVSILDQIDSAQADLSAANEAIADLAIPLRHRDLSVQACLETLAKGSDAKVIEQEIDRNNPVKDILDDHFRGVDTNTDALTKAIKFSEAVEEAHTWPTVKKAIFEADTPKILEKLVDWHLRSAPNLDAFIKDVSSIASTYMLDETAWFGSDDECRDFDHFRDKADHAIEHINLLGDWISYLQNKRSVCEKGLADLVDLIEQDKLPGDQIDNALGYMSYFPHADELASSDKYFSNINGDALNEIRSSFVRLDEKTQELNKQGIAAVLDTRIIPQGISGPKVKDKTELELILHEVNLKKPRTPIRQLVKRAGKALLGLKPCWMMGPMSVAQYLEAGKIEFDLVIMDEASQMRPEDAIGCIARAKQVIVVGDPKQLPPTSFFNKNVEFEDEDDDLAGVEESESILDAANTIFRPARRLRWHYRSQCEDLIAFSNKNFYNDDLVVFPSPNHSSCINFEYIPKASCKKGRNPTEAHRVAQRAIEFMESGTSNSLGVVALNSVQQQLIEDEFNKLLKFSPLAEAYMERRAKGAERFFIKNLENVQGDERDVIMISFTYGPDPISGKIMNRFGPINSSAGWRRLNVLYTRAKKRIHVISSMRADDIKLSADTQLGPRVMKGYLAFAETGQLETGFDTGKDPDSDFEIAVATALKLRGYDCVAQLGVSGYFLDLVVKNPDVPDGYIMGIECDGATYHSAKSVRDRDRLRQLVLERLGWNVERIWSTDWFEDSERQIDRICSRIEILRERHSLYRKKQEAKAAAIQNTHEEGAQSGKHSIPLPQHAPPPKTGISALQQPNRAHGFISREEAKEQLIELRENVINIENPSADRSKGILRNEMIDALIRTLPQDSKEFLQFIPAYMRGDATDGAQLKKYGQRIFDILMEVDE